MPNENNIALLPLDNRPISYLLPKQIADFSGIDFIMPDKKYLGDLKTGSDLEYIEKWCRGLINQTPTLVISLDNWVYGGLVQSRKHSCALDELRNRINKLKELNKIEKCGFSSILRIANYDNNEEEKDYWKDYGKKIFRWSELMYKVGRGVHEEGISNEELIENWYQSSREIPVATLADYKGHRDKNFTINLEWLESLHKSCFKYLIFACDDSSKYGMNVVEAEYLKSEIRKHNFSTLAKIISGTDEIPLVLLTKEILNKSRLKPVISLYFSSISGKDNLARYESNSIYSSVVDQIQTLGLEIKDFNSSDVLLCVHCADSIQGDHIFSLLPKDTTENSMRLKTQLEKTNKPFIIIDLAYANGADPNLIEFLLQSKINWQNCYGYAGWNTCSNSTGSALSIGVNRWLAEKNKTFNEKLFKQCLLVRFLDDYAYQAKIRHVNITESEINTKMKPYVQTLSKLFELNDINVKCLLPWERSFEVEIEL